MAANLNGEIFCHLSLYCAAVQAFTYRLQIGDCGLPIALSEHNIIICDPQSPIGNKSFIR